MKLLRKILACSRFKQPAIEDYLASLFALNNSCFMIQVGANDGKLCDPIRKYVLNNIVKGLMLEPQPEVFERLVKNYKGIDGLEFINAALANAEGVIKLYKVHDDLVKIYPDLSGVASFSKEHVYKEIRSNRKQLKIDTKSIDTYIQEELVTTVTYKLLIEKYLINNVDLLLIDAEGFDYEAVVYFPYDLVQPKAIVFEYKHMRKDRLKELEGKLTVMGYISLYAKNDVLFVKAQ